MKTEIKAHLEKYPQMQVEDIFKLLYQGVFGCEHLAAAEETVTKRIEAEALSDFLKREPFIEKISQNYSRVYLNCLNEGVSVKTLAKLFILSAQGEKGTVTDLEKNLNAAKEVIATEKTAISLSEIEAGVCKWKEDGYPPISHSDIYKSAYNPAYRVVSNKLVPFIPVFSKIDSLPKEKPLIIAIEGGSASGKTTLGKMLKEIFYATVFHVDDYFLMPHQRTKERLAEIGGNFDRERLLNEILIPVKNGETVNFSRFDCKTQSLMPPETVKPQRITVIEGAYSMHPELREFYDLTVFLDIDKELQKARVTARNGEMASRFFNEWIPLEDSYFEELDIKKKSDIIIKIGE